MTEPEPVDADRGDGPPIFEAVRSGYLYAFGRDLPRFSEQQASQSSAGQLAGLPASWGDGRGRAVARPPTAGLPASAGLPQRIPQPGQVRSPAVAQETQQAPVTEPAEITRSKLASFQRGSRRARAVARVNRGANQQPGQDG